MSDLQRWLPRVAFVWILFVISFGLFEVPRLELSVDLPAQTGTILFVLLLVIAIINVTTIRFLFLPRALARPEPHKDQIVLTSYIFAVAPATYGLVISLVTGQGMLTLPFAVIAFFGLFVYWSYLRRAAVE